MLANKNLAIFGKGGPAELGVVALVAGGSAGRAARDELGTVRPAGPALAVPRPQRAGRANRSAA